MSKYLHSSFCLRKTGVEIEVSTSRFHVNGCFENLKDIDMLFMGIFLYMLLEKAFHAWTYLPLMHVSIDYMGPLLLYPKVDRFPRGRNMEHKGIYHIISVKFRVWVLRLVHACGV